MYLEQISFVVVIDQYPELLERAYDAVAAELESLGSFGIVFDGFNGIALPALGLEARARQIYAAGVEASGETYVAPGVLGILAASFGDLDAAYAHFEAAYDERSLILSWLRDPLLPELREDPRYAELMQRAGLEP